MRPLTRRTLLAALALAPLGLLGCQAGNAPANPSPAAAGTPFVVVNNTPQAAVVPLHLGLVQPDWEPVQLVAAALGADERRVNSLDAQLYADGIDSLLQTGANAIIATGDPFSAVTAAAADHFPLTAFLGIGQQYDHARANLGVVLLPSDQLGFLAGALAALVSKKGIVGAALGPAAQRPVARMTDGFIAGAQYINSSIQTQLANEAKDPPDGYQDPAGGQDAVANLLKQGADVIFVAGGKTGDGALDACAAQGIPVISGESKRSFSAAQQKIVLGVVDYVLDPATILGYVNQVRAGTPPDNARLAVEFGPSSQVSLPSGAQDRITQIVSGLRDGSIRPVAS